MSKTPSFTSKEIIKFLSQKGFILDRVKGSHHRGLMDQNELLFQCIIEIYQSGPSTLYSDKLE